jgi:hypothetical protein
MPHSEFYEIARKTAKIIHEKSWEANGILHVMLYGSTLHHSQPEDIDLLVIHDGKRLAPYFFYRKIMIGTPPAEDNARMPPFDFLKELGYLEGSCRRDSVLANVNELVSPRNVNDIYDMNSLDVALLKDEDKIIKDPDKITQGFTQGVFGSCHFGSVRDVRERAIKSCRETNFWYTILSEGKIYDLHSGDFSIEVNKLYPDAIQFFPSTPDTNSIRP